MEVVKQAKSTFLCFSILNILLGVCLIIWPGISATTLCIIFGILLMVMGVVRIICYFDGRFFGLPLFADMSIGIMCALLGLLLIIHPGDAATIVSLIIGICLIIDGAFKLQTSVDIKRVGVKYWWYILILAVLTAACGVLIVCDPFTGAAALMIAMGISLIIDGVQNICTVAYVSRFINKNKPIDTYYTVE